MHPRVLILVALLAIPFAASTLVRAQAPTLEERMSQEEFTAAGLDKLTPEQLKYLNDWVQSKGVSEIGAPIRHRDGTSTFYADDQDREVVESAIAGEFNGWHGKTRVTLENGQVWEQVESGSSGFRLQSPKVKIKPMSMGSWLMYVNGCNCDIRVKRIK
ncbi:MAG: hypothetical protein IPP82_04410 [Xanthomonadales bacterium]|nr:hypothetical protein [Xanthomonadales bacterium]